MFGQCQLELSARPLATARASTDAAFPGAQTRPSATKSSTGAAARRCVPYLYGLVLGSLPDRVHGWVLGRAQLLPNKARLRSVQLLQNKAGNMGSTFTILGHFFLRRALGSNFRLVRLDLGPVQDVGIPVREHSAGIKTSKSEFWGGQNPHFFRPAGATVSTARWPVLDMPSRGRPGRELSMASSFYRFMARSAAFTN